MFMAKLSAFPADDWTCMCHALRFDGVLFSFAFPPCSVHVVLLRSFYSLPVYQILWNTQHAANISIEKSSQSWRCFSRRSGRSLFGFILIHRLCGVLDMERFTLFPFFMRLSENFTSRIHQSKCCNRTQPNSKHIQSIQRWIFAV